MQQQMRLLEHMWNNTHWFLFLYWNKPTAIAYAICNYGWEHVLIGHSSEYKVIYNLSLSQAQLQSYGVWSLTPSSVFTLINTVVLDHQFLSSGADQACSLSHSSFLGSHLFLLLLAAGWWLNRDRAASPPSSIPTIQWLSFRRLSCSLLSVCSVCLGCKLQQQWYSSRI